MAVYLYGVGMTLAAKVNDAHTAVYEVLACVTAIRSEQRLVAAVVASASRFDDAFLFGTGSMRRR